jgi:hypothetical protein
MMAEAEKTPWVTRWGRDDHSWNIVEPSEDDPDEDEEGGDSDGSGNPGRYVVGRAVRSWSMTQPSVPDAATIAAIFNLPISMAEDTLDHLDLFTPARNLAVAVGTWSFLQGGPTSVALAATVFQLAPAVIVDALQGAGSPYLFLCGDGADFDLLMIEHDGD